MPKLQLNSGSSGKSAYAAYVGRLNYAYANKYLAEASFRYDGSYKFAKGHRWGFFPSVSFRMGDVGRRLFQRRTS